MTSHEGLQAAEHVQEYGRKIGVEGERSKEKRAEGSDSTNMGNFP